MLELNTIYNMDCMNGMKLLDNNSVDLIITDPPYRFENKGGGFYADNDSTKRQYLDSLMKIDCCDFKPLEFLETIKPKMKKFYGYFFCNKTLVEEYLNWARTNNYQYDILIMAKTNPMPAYSNHHLSDLEYIIMIREKGTYFSEHKEIDDYRKFYLTNCEKGEHPSQKPIELIRRFVRVSSQQNDIIVDPFMGSGTTGIACVKENRNFIGFENNQGFHEMSVKRISWEQRQQTLF